MRGWGVDGGRLIVSVVSVALVVVYVNHRSLPGPNGPQVQGIVLRVEPVLSQLVSPRDTVTAPAQLSFGGGVKLRTSRFPNPVAPLNPPTRT